MKQYNELAESRDLQKIPYRVILIDEYADLSMAVDDESKLEAAVTETAIEPRYVEAPIPDDVYIHDTCADPTKLRAATGWRPTIDLRDGIRDVCRQY